MQERRRSSLGIRDACRALETAVRTRVRRELRRLRPMALPKSRFDVLRRLGASIKLGLPSFAPAAINPVVE